MKIVFLAAGKGTRIFLKNKNSEGFNINKQNFIN